MAVLKTIYPVAYTDPITEIVTGDGTCLYGGYLYILSRSGTCKIAQVDTTTYAVAKTAELYDMNGDFLCQSGGSLWASGQFEGAVYEVSPTLLTKTSQTQVFTGAFDKIYAGCTDDTYIYVGGMRTTTSDLPLASMKISDKSTVVGALDFGTAWSSHFHSMCQDSLYLYGHINRSVALTAYAIKVAKADLSTVTASAALTGGAYCDGCEFDDNFIYFAEEYTNGGRLAKVAKSDLSVTYSQVTAPDLVKGFYGIMRLLDGSIVTLDSHTLSDYKARLYKFDKSGTYEYAVDVGGMLDAAHACDDIVFGGDYFYLTTFVAAGTAGIRVYKCRVSDLYPAYHTVADAGSSRAVADAGSSRVLVDAGSYRAVGG